MNAIQESKLNMFHSVLAHCDANAAITKTIPAFDNAITGLKTTVSAISSTVQQQLRSTNGITISKTENRLSLSSLAIEIAGAVFAYASDAGNTVLKNAVKITDSELIRCRDEELGPKCSGILKLAEDNKDTLKDYGITAEVITSFQAAIDAYTIAVPAPRNAVAQKTAYSESLKALFKTCDRIVKEKLSKLAPKFKKDNFEFFTAFVANKTIVDPPSTVTQIRGAITEDKTGVILKEAAIEITELGIIARSNAKGIFAIKPLTPGQYTFKISKDGFIQQTIPDVKITRGVINKLDIKLRA